MASLAVTVLLFAIPTSSSPDVVLITLDTLRADALFRDQEGTIAAKVVAHTPVLDSLMARGTRYNDAVSASPLTLPAHVSVMTGLNPLEHGVRDNGTVALGTGIPTLASELAALGYETAAIVASRVIDRRFGLARGFEHYDDRMLAEQVGEYGYPERDAAAVTDAALAWLSARTNKRPVFLWVHYYDAHAPYDPPLRFSRGPTDSDAQRYAGEIAFIDEQLGRLLAALPRQPEDRVVAVVGDHGEALGDHGERTHGLFVYGEVLQVPLILAGRGVPAGAVVAETVASRQLASTLVHLVSKVKTSLGGPVLPGLGPSVVGGTAPAAVYSETRLPETTYGWSPLRAVTGRGWRLIVAPRSELYNLRTDPAETVNLIDGERRQARRLQRALGEFERVEALPSLPVLVDPGLAAELRSLGYVDGSRGGDATSRSGLDPKDGLSLLEELAEAKQLLARGNSALAAERLAALVAKSPGNGPFLAAYGAASLAAGQGKKAIAAFEAALALNPRLEFLHHRLAQAHLTLGQTEPAVAALERALKLDPRYAAAWLTLAEVAHRRGDARAETKVLERALVAGANSAAILLRMAQLTDAAGSIDAAERHLRRASELAPAWALVWFERGRFLLRRGRTADARQSLERARDLEPSSAIGREAARLLRGGVEK